MKIAAVIPAIKKNVAFTDDLVKKLAGITLIQRTLDKAKILVPLKHIYVVTDSEEIRLICDRNKVNSYHNEELKLKPSNIIENLNLLSDKIAGKYQDIIILSPYAPLLNAEEIQKAFKSYKAKDEKLLIPVRREFSRAYFQEKQDLKNLLGGGSNQKLLIEAQGFQICSGSLVRNGFNAREVTPMTYEISPDLVEIRSYQDWWVCEKLLKRKKIVFRVIGNEKCGMGHIQRSLTLAHEITDHEIRFVCDMKSKIAAKKLVGHDYWLGVYKPDEIEDKILSLKPDLVINDILNSDSDYIRKLRTNNILVINFEDLGDGSKSTNLTINELYDEPLVQGDNILWGREYFFIREEFNDAQPNKFEGTVRNLLIMFGGTDPSDYTRKILRFIKDDCGTKNIKIYIVTGGGYPFIKELEKEIDRITDTEIEYHHSIGVVSHIMEKAQIAISANGRTAYELAHMNIPSIVLSHHEREDTHKFTQEENGHIPIGTYKGLETEKKVVAAFQRLTTDTNYRKMLFDRLEPFQFEKNKEKVIGLIYSMFNC